MQQMKLEIVVMNEQSLKKEIDKTWGKNSPHAIVYNDLSNKVGKLEARLKAIAVVASKPDLTLEPGNSEIPNNKRHCFACGKFMRLNKQTGAHVCYSKRCNSQKYDDQYGATVSCMNCSESNCPSCSPWNYPCPNYANKVACECSYCKWCGKGN